MGTRSKHGSEALGTTLVAAQFGLLAVLVVSALPVLRNGLVPVATWVLWALGATLGAWALQANRPGNFNIRPAPRAGGKLVIFGPYRWIRHPMYTSVGAFAVGCAFAAAWAPAWAVVVLLAAVLTVKSILEERWLRQIHAEYAAYERGTFRFVPWLV